MTSYKLLIDTNIFIGLEDARLIDNGFSDFHRSCQEYGVGLFIHEASIRDISRDKDETRKNISLSKINKFQRLAGIKQPEKTALERAFGPIQKHNDEVDVSLLYALTLGAVDFLVTQDEGIHSRVKQSELAKRVLRISDALQWLRQTFEPTSIKLPFVVQKRAHEIDLADEIFASLREGYPGFDTWWQKCIQAHRHCWVIEIGAELAGICVRKDEGRHEATVTLPGKKILKLCTFKVKPKFQGEKLGEHLLKQALWFAQRNAYDLVYLTTKPDQLFLISVLEYFGFAHTHTLGENEWVFEKPLSRARLAPDKSTSVYIQDRLNYPRFIADETVVAYCVPIRGEFHRRLFPEIAFQEPLPLLSDQPTLYGGGRDARTPGNTIRKVYVCRAQANSLKPGDILFFYESKTKDFIASQSITSVGVLESMSYTDNLDELIHLTAKRSAYTREELRDIVSENLAPVKVLDFLLVGHFDKPIGLETLKQIGVFGTRPPQSIAKLSHEKLSALKAHLALGFEV